MPCAMLYQNRIIQNKMIKEVKKKINKKRAENCVKEVQERKLIPEIISLLFDTEVRL